MKRRETLLFVVLTFAWSWGLWSLTVPRLRRLGFDNAEPWTLGLHLLGSYGPTLVALGLTWYFGEKGAARDLLRQLLEWRGRTGKLLVALLVPTAASLLALAAYAATNEAIAFDFSRAALIPIALLAALPFGPLGEEIGWRGFAQPRLLCRFGPFLTGLLLGAIWFVWHVPLFFAPAGTSVSGSSLTVSGLLLYFGLLTGMSILIVWFTQWTGSALLSGLMIHLGMNAEIYRLFFDLSTEQLTRIERWSVLPIWVLVVLLFSFGRRPAAPALPD